MSVTGTYWLVEGRLWSSRLGSYLDEPPVNVYPTLAAAVAALGSIDAIQEASQVALVATAMHSESDLCQVLRDAGLSTPSCDGERGA